MGEKYNESTGYRLNPVSKRWERVNKDDGHGSKVGGSAKDIMSDYAAGGADYTAEEAERFIDSVFYELDTEIEDGHYMDWMDPEILETYGEDSPFYGWEDPETGVYIEQHFVEAVERFSEDRDPISEKEARMLLESDNIVARMLGAYLIPENNDEESSDALRFLAQKAADDADEMNSLKVDYFNQLEVEWPLARAGYEQERYSKSSHNSLRALVAENGNFSEKLHKDESAEVRAAVGRSGKYSDVLRKDDDPEVRAAVAKSGNFRDELSSDPDPIVRKAVADTGYDFHKMVNDPDESVREKASFAYSRDIFRERLDAIKGFEGDERRSASIKFDKEYAKSHALSEQQLDALASNRSTEMIAASYIPDNNGSGQFDDIVNKIASDYRDSEAQFELIRKGYALEKLSKSEVHKVRNAAEEEKKRRGM